eukprot:4814849-Amphidinium_carterae.4
MHAALVKASLTRLASRLAVWDLRGGPSHECWEPDVGLERFRLSTSLWGVSALRDPIPLTVGCLGLLCNRALKLCEHSPRMEGYL